MQDRRNNLSIPLLEWGSDQSPRLNGPVESGGRAGKNPASTGNGAAPGGTAFGGFGTQERRTNLPTATQKPPTICVELASTIRMVKLPVRTYEQVVRDAIERASTPCVNGNGSPAIQPGYRKGQKPLSTGKTYPAEILTAGEVFALLDALPKTGPVGVRNRALIVLLWRTGLRIQEALDLEPKDIDFDRGTVTVLRGKGSKRRTVAIDRRALEYVGGWLDYRQKVPGVDPWSPVFCTVAQNGRPVQAVGQPYARRMMKRAARKARIRKRVHPHCLRHSLAAGLADEGVDLRVVQRQLGHSNVAVTARYVDHLTPGKALEVVQAREWPEGVS
jgi:integrase